jgi:hypothetical protein
MISLKLIKSVPGAVFSTGTMGAGKNERNYRTLRSKSGINYSFTNLKQRQR